MAEDNGTENSQQENQSQEGQAKEFQLISTRGIKTSEVFRKRVTNIKIDNEMMEVNMIPEKYNAVPKMYLNDITGIQLSTKIANYFLYAVVLLCVVGIASLEFYFGIAALIFLWAGRNSKITITLKNGMEAEIYSVFKSDSVEFVDYLKQITNLPEE